MVQTRKTTKISQYIYINIRIRLILNIFRKKKTLKTIHFLKSVQRKYLFKLCV